VWTGHNILQFLPDTLMFSGAICGRSGQKWRHILETSPVRCKRIM